MTYWLWKSHIKSIQKRGNRALPSVILSNRLNV